MEGWIKLHRGLLTWEWYSDRNTTSLFIHLLIKASYTDNKWRGIDVKRGQVVTGRIKLSEELGLSQQVIRTCLERLKSTNEITIKSTSKYSLLTVVNYNNYQDSDGEPTSKSTNEQPASNQQSTTTKEGKKEKKVKKEHTDIVLPEWIDQELWDGFMDIRKAKKAANTDTALKNLILKLTRFKESGINPNEALANSIENSWKGVFEPSNNSSPAQQKPAQQYRNLN